MSKLDLLKKYKSCTLARIQLNPNQSMHSDSKKRRWFLALLFAAGDVRRYPGM